MACQKVCKQGRDDKCRVLYIYLHFYIIPILFAYSLAFHHYTLLHFNVIIFLFLYFSELQLGLSLRRTLLSTITKTPELETLYWQFSSGFKQVII